MEVFGVVDSGRELQDLRALRGALERFDAATGEFSEGAAERLGIVQVSPEVLAVREALSAVVGHCGGRHVGA